MKINHVLSIKQEDIDEEHLGNLKKMINPKLDNEDERKLWNVLYNHKSAFVKDEEIREIKVEEEVEKILHKPLKKKSTRSRSKHCVVVIRRRSK